MFQSYQSYPLSSLDDRQLSWMHTCGKIIGKGAPVEP
jgi:hypothetical protein